MPVRCQKSSPASAKKLKQEINMKGMYTTSLNQLHKPVQPQRELWNAVAASHSACSYLLLPTSHSLSCCQLYFSLSPFFFCSQGRHPDNVQSHTSVWFSSALFGSVQAASGTSFMYNDQRGCNLT